MQRRSFYIIPMAFFIIVLSVLVGITIAQPSTAAQTFATYQIIGKQRPSGITYSQVNDQIAWVDPSGSLQLIDASDFSLQHQLYRSGLYNAYIFSPDGRYLALAIERRIEIWDTRNGDLNLLLEPDGSLGVEGPLFFADDGDLLLFNSRVPAPQSIRRSENDTSLVPWLWDLADARGEAPSTLAGRAEALPIFDYRNGFILGPNRKAIAALPGRLQILDLQERNRPITDEIESNRLERDTITVWSSMADDSMYVQPRGSNNIVQINTETGRTLLVSPGRDLIAGRYASLQDLVLSNNAQIIGEPNSRQTTPLTRLLLQGDYRSNFNYNPLTIMLLDILQPITPTAGGAAFLIYVRDEISGRGFVDFVRSADTNQIALHPDGTHIAVRRTSGLQPVEIYNIANGALESNYYPAISDSNGDTLFTFNTTGDELLVDFQRFDLATGDILYEDLGYFRGYSQYLFSPDSQSIYTFQTALSGDVELWEWDIETASVIRREPLNVRGSVIDASVDAQRYLSIIQTVEGLGVEITDTAEKTRQSLFFESLPGREFSQIIPSVNWQNYLVIYGVTQASQHFPGNEIAIYNLYEGKQWFFAGTDLPAPDGANYGWMDTETIFIRGNQNASGAPDRVYGLEYAASGLPQCLVDAFPDADTQLAGFWDYVSAINAPDELGRITQAICDLVTEARDLQDITNFFTPSPAPTLVFPTQRPSVIAGVPTCLTQRFSDEALAYAEEWRNLTEGLSQEQISQLERLLCEGLSGSSSPNRRAPVTSEDDVMLIDINTGIRKRGTFLPDTTTNDESTAQPSLSLVLDAFDDQYRRTPNNARLSPDTSLLAEGRSANRIVLYRLVRPYEALAGTATATNQPLEPQVRRIRVRPTATQSLNIAGRARPTLTPTITPTPPPQPIEDADLVQLNQREEICPVNTIYTLENPPPDYNPPGSLFTSLDGAPDGKTVFNPQTGATYVDDTLPSCAEGCQPSFDGQWLLIREADEIFVVHADGSDKQVLFSGDDNEFWPDPYWIDPVTIEYQFSSFVRATPTLRAPSTISPEQTIFVLPADRVTPNPPFVPSEARISRSAITQRQQYNVQTRQYSDPFTPRGTVRINNLDTELVNVQPYNGDLEVYRTTYRTRPQPGFRYYIVNRATGTQDYFARTETADPIEFNWHPAGNYLYYRYPSTAPDEWLIYDPMTEQHQRLGDLPRGTWSANNRYSITPYRFNRADYIPANAILITPLPPLYPTPVATRTPDFIPLQPTVTPGPDGFADSADRPLQRGKVTYIDATELLIPKLRVWDSETGLSRLYCVPGTSVISPDIVSGFIWSPDNRYVAFQAFLQSNRQTQAETARPSWYILDTATGSLTDIGFDIERIDLWLAIPPN